MKKRNLWTAGVLAASIICSCFICSACGKGDEGEGQPINPPKQEEKTAVEGPVFITLGSSVMGYWGAGEWHSLDSILYDPYTAADAPKERDGKDAVQAYLYEMLAAEQYYLYDIRTGAVETVGKVYIPEQLELSSLDLTENPFGQQSFYDTDEIKALFAPYQQQTAVDEYNNTQDYFALPVVFPEDSPLRSFPLPNDLFYLGFLDENNEDIRPVGIALSQEVDGFPKDLVVRADGTEEEKAFVQAHLDSVAMGDSDFVITEVWTGDVDGDGKEEKLIIAATPETESGYPIIQKEDLTNEKAAVFILALLVKDGEATTLFYQQEPIKAAYERGKENADYNIYIGDEIFLGIETCLGLNVEGIFDFNGDGKYEICLGNICWDIPEKRVLELQKDGSWQTVLYGSFGW
ncbi:MAG: hypothetical protein HFI72_04675 [Peptococcaceae bacterium]|nr:hypothetical protein [Peptococcaceae bacterium]